MLIFEIYLSTYAYYYMISPQPFYKHNHKLFPYMVLEVKLTQNKFALIDDDDVCVCGLKWYYASGYALHRIYAGKTIIMHRFIIERSLGRILTKDEIVDHINHDSLDNRKCNLRIVSKSENNKNRRPTFSRKPYHKN